MIMSCHRHYSVPSSFSIDINITINFSVVPNIYRANAAKRAAAIIPIPARSLPDPSLLTSEGPDPDDDVADPPLFELVGEVTKLPEPEPEPEDPEPDDPELDPLLLVGEEPIA